MTDFTPLSSKPSPKILEQIKQAGIVGAGGAGADVLDDPVSTIDLDDVSHLEGPAEDEDEAADEVIEEVLGSKSNGHRYCAAQEREGRQGDVDDLQGDEDKGEPQDVEDDALRCAGRRGL